MYYYGGVLPRYIIRAVTDVVPTLAQTRTAAVGRFDRSRGRSIESIGSIGSVILQIFRLFCNVGELETCLVSKFQLCTTLGGQKDAENPKRNFSEFFGSVGSVFRSVRSILSLRVGVDRSGH